MLKPLLALALGLLAFAAYANSLGNGLVWDDPVILARQLPVFRISSVWLPPRNVPQFAADYYRPLVIATYLIDYRLGGGQPWWFHFTVVLAHALATAAVFAFGCALFRRVPACTDSRAIAAAALGASLFALHPVHTEAVAWMAGRADVFAALFGVTAAWAHIESRRKPALAFLAAAALLLALLSKEVSLSLLLLLPLLDLMVPDAPPAAAAAPRAQKRRSAAAAATAPLGSPALLLRYAPLAAATVVYAALRLTAIGTGLDVRTGESVGFLPLRLVAAFALYMQRLFLPVSLNALILELPENAFALLAGALAIAALAVAVVVALRRGAAPIAFLIVCIVVGLAPSLSILIKIPEVPAAERYLYLPSVGFCLLSGWFAAAGLVRGGAIRWATGAIAALVLLLCLGATVARNRVWASDLALWTDTVEKSPRGGMPLSSLADALVRANRLDEAERAYRESLNRVNTAHGRAATYSNLGLIALTRGSLEQAEDNYRRGLALRVSPEGLYSLAVIALRRAEAARGAGDEQAGVALASGALADLERAERMAPADANLQLALGHALDVLGRRAEARPHYQRALALGLAPEAARQVQAALAQPQ